MDRDSPYYRQVQLLFGAIPYVATENCFALKGGTAINLFHLPMPRLSVDIDLTYVPIENREISLKNASEALHRIVDKMTGSSPGLDAKVVPSTHDHYRAMVHGRDVQIKIELNPVTRGVIHEPLEMEAHVEVQDEFGFAAMQVVQAPDLYGGKICAALDRQHPRDLFDVKLLLDSNGFTREVFEGFLVYLLSSPRPMAELLAPHLKDTTDAYTNHFEGMTRNPVTNEELVQARDRLVADISAYMTDNDKDFLLSFKSGTPQWDLMPVPVIEQLPAVRWKLMNIHRMSQKKHRKMLINLQSVVDGM